MKQQTFTTTPQFSKWIPVAEFKGSLPVGPDCAEKFLAIVDAIKNAYPKERVHTASQARLYEPVNDITIHVGHKDIDE